MAKSEVLSAALSTPLPVSPAPEMLHIIVPVYNEAENFPALREALVAQIRTPFEVFVVYDFNEDTTVPVVQKAIQEGDTRFHLVKNTFGRGVVGALRTGFQCTRRGPLLVMMGDLSDDLVIVDQMVRLHQQGAHLVAASRYMRGGRMIGGPLLKRNFSKWAGLSLHWFRGIPIHDSTNSFKLYDAEMLNSLKLESQGGFELSLEITVKSFLAGYRLAEVPTTWRDRTQGTSRFRMWRWLPRYLQWYFFAFQPRASGLPISD
jgi:glycosyltransferase involved in cell wall biosynthesis